MASIQYSPETHLCGRWQAIVCRNELTFMMISSLGSHFCKLCQATVCREELTAILDADVPNEVTTAKQKQWLRHCQLDMCSQLQHGVQPRRSFLRTVSSDSLQRWAHSWAYSTLMSPMNAVVLTTARQEQWLRDCQFDMMYSPEAHLCGLWQATVCRNEHTLLMLELDPQPRQLFLRSMSSNSLGWAHSCSVLNADVPNECCSADYR